MWVLQAKAAAVFPAAPMKPFLEDYLTVFRRVCLNPSNKTSNEIPDDVKNAIINILKAFETDSETTKSIAHTMTESMPFIELINFMMDCLDCEPFILQAEMGLTGKALSVLSVVAQGSQPAAEIILPQIMLWLGNLMNGQFLNIVVQILSFFYFSGYSKCSTKSARNYY